MRNNQRIENEFKAKTRTGDEVTCFITAESPTDCIHKKEMVLRSSWNNDVAVLAGDRDRVWFEKNPDRKYRLRRKIQKEFHPDGIKWVLVYALAPNLRARIPVPSDLNYLCDAAKVKKGRLPPELYEALALAIVGEEQFTQLGKIGSVLLSKEDQSQGVPDESL